MKLTFRLTVAAFFAVLIPVIATAALPFCNFCGGSTGCTNGVNPAGLSCGSACQWMGSNYTCADWPGWSWDECCHDTDSCSTQCSKDYGGCDPVDNDYGMTCGSSCYSSGMPTTCNSYNTNDCCKGYTFWCSECESLCKPQSTPCQNDPYAPGTCPAPPENCVPNPPGQQCDCGSPQDGDTVDLYLDCVINENYVPNEYVYTASRHTGYTVSYPNKNEYCGENDCQSSCVDDWETDPYGWYYDYESCCYSNYGYGGCGPTYNACPEEN